MDRKIVFLHIPKTAGQSVDSFLRGFFPEPQICPARTNDQLSLLSIDRLRSFDLFSGHLDWSMLDCVGGRTYTFTVLRDPIDRILSFYYYNRTKASELSEDMLSRPENTAMRAALTLSCDDFFTGGQPMIRNFLDNHYDNFYTHFFAGRSYDSRLKFGPLRRREGVNYGSFLVDLASDNLGKLDGIFTVDSLDALDRAISGFMDRSSPSGPLADIRINVGQGDRRRRWEGLKEFGATNRAYERILAMVRFDQVVWKRFKDRHHPVPV